MFDLFRSRDKAVRAILTVMLGLVALSMVAYLVPGGMPGSGSGSEATVAEVCDQKITARDLQLRIQAITRGGQYPQQMIHDSIPEFVNQYVSERAVACQASDMGFKVSDQEVASMIRAILPQVFQGGFNKEVYSGMLAQQNMTIPEFEANVRKQLLLNKLTNLVVEGLVVTPEEVEGEFRKKNEKIKVEYVAFSPEKFRDQVKVSPADMQDYFNKNRAQFRIPEKRSFDLVVISEEKIGAMIDLPESVIRQAYNNAGDRYRTGERVKVRHILLKTTEMGPDAVKKQEAKANDLLKQIKAGADIAKLARENSDDPGSKERGGDLDWVVKGQTVPNFEQAAFALKKGEISNVVKTEYGYHILQVYDREDAKVKPFEEVKAELTTELKRQQAQTRMETAAEQVRAELLKNLKGGAEIAQKLGVSFYHIDNAGAGDPIQEVGVAPDLEAAISGLQANAVTPVIVAPGNKLVVAALTGITPARNAEFNEVEAQVRSQLTAVKARELAVAKQTEIANALKASPGDLKKVAQIAGAEVKTSSEFGREGAIEGVGSATYFLELFDKQPGAVVGPVNIADQVAVAKLESKVAADTSKLAAERDSLTTALKGRKAQERQDLFKDGLVTKLIDKGKVKIDNDAIKRLMASYRS